MSTGTQLKFGVGLLGGPKVGTTAMMLRLKNDTFVSNQDGGNIIDLYLKVIPIDSKTTVKLCIYYNAFTANLTTPYHLYRRMTCAILVYSVTDKQSLSHVTRWAREYEKHRHGEGLMFMMGNKIDEEREVSEEDANALYESLGCKRHFLVSVKTGEGLENAFKEIAKCLVEEEREDGQTDDNIITLGSENSQPGLGRSSCRPCQT